MAECTGTARAGSAGDPDWFSQAEKQMTELYKTLTEIGDESILSAFDDFEDHVRLVQRIKGADQ
ncbi:MAG: hypothetical protein CL843_19680 [Crocinitomicaceae bacterium]|nr:hypothetical protein [Crocinitomicaceae bacterium]|tara:strand:- start:460 stop:651 length:192 start_codon:yes stop_codon:yes gene_type:complete